MSSFNLIGLDNTKAAELASKLNKLLANYQIFYSNLRGYHWNIKGEKFFELHLKFEELYNDAFLKIDEIAERILTLGFTPLHTYTDYIAESEIKTAKDVTEGKIAVKSILNSFSILIRMERDILNLSSDTGDEGTNALMSDYIREQEKSVWMYSAFLG
ncbi:MAG: DNA starvation/stationary phase protection protein [Candidatus Kapabacteria bacterium]|nr:DNA starvation/stationary phase protection protein [Ignavibacteriota bacterium]MCW5883337.1 DNA starvation/stationary phase protection protein [Candidatus Kapabacteria bacterium]